MPTVYLNLSKFCLCGRVTSAQHALYVKGVDSFSYDIIEKKARIVYQEENISLDEIIDLMQYRNLEVETIEKVPT